MTTREPLTKSRINIDKMLSHNIQFYTLSIGCHTVFFARAPRGRDGGTYVFPAAMADYEELSPCLHRASSSLAPLDILVADS
jgi:hypothetical protein